MPDAKSILAELAQQGNETPAAPPRENTAAETAVLPIQGINKGVVGALGLPGDVVNAISGLLGFAPGPYNSQNLVELYNKYVPSVTPQTEGERILERTGEQVGATLPVTGGMMAGARAIGAGGKLMTGTVKATLSYLDKLREMDPRTLLTLESTLAAGGGAGAGVGRELAKQEGAGAFGQGVADFVGSLIGSFGMGGALGLIRLAKQGVAKMLPTVTRSGTEANVSTGLKETVGATPTGMTNLDESIDVASQVPGFRPTTAQAAGTKTASTFNAAAVEKNPELAGNLEQRQVENRAAVNQALETAAPEGQITDAQAAVRANVEGQKAAVQAPVEAATQLEQAARARFNAARTDLDARLTGYVDHAAQEMSETAAKIGPLVDRRAAGETILRNLEARKTDVAAKAGELFEHVDPENVVKLPTSDITASINGVVGEAAKFGDTVSGRLKKLASIIAPSLPEDEAAIAENVAKRLGAPVDDSKVQKVLADMGIKAGPQDMTFNNLREWRSRLLEERRDLLRGVNPDTRQARGVQQVLNAIDATLDKTAELTSNPAAERYREAAAAYKDYADRFLRGTVAAVMQRGPRGEQVRSAMEDLAGQFFTSGKGAQTRAQDFVNTVGDVDTARRALRSYAIRDFFDAATDTTGTIDSKRAAKWLQRHQEPLDVFPEIGEEVRTLVRAKGTLEERMQQAEKLRQQAAKGQIPYAADALSAAQDQLVAATKSASRQVAEIDKSAAALFVNVEPGQAVDRIMKSANPQAGMADLVRMTEGNVAAQRGLRRAVWDRMWDEIQTAKKDVGGNPVRDPIAMGQFMERHASLFERLYSREELGRLKTLQKALEINERGSNVPLPGMGAEESQQVLAATGSVFSRAYNIARGMVSVPYVVGESVAREVNKVLKHFHGTQLRAVLDAAVFDPQIAKELMALGKPGMKAEQIIPRWELVIAANTPRVKPAEPAPAQ